MASYIFAMLAENSLNVEKVQVTRGNIVVRQSGNTAQGSLTARAAATIDGESVTLKIKIELQ